MKLPEAISGEIILLYSPPPKAMSTIAARLALGGAVCVLDAGNQFNAYRIAREVRRQTADLNPILNRIQVARAFTCYQVVALFEQSGAAAPHVVLDLLATFADENVSLNESCRLLQIVISHLKRLRSAAPVVVSIYPPRQAECGRLMQMVMSAADHLFSWEPPPAIEPVQLF